MSTPPDLLEQELALPPLARRFRRTYGIPAYRQGESTGPAAAQDPTLPPAAQAYRAKYRASAAGSTARTVSGAPGVARTPDRPAPVAPAGEPPALAETLAGSEHPLAYLGSFVTEPLKSVGRGVGKVVEAVGYTAQAVGRAQEGPQPDIPGLKPLLGDREAGRERSQALAEIGQTIAGAPELREREDLGGARKFLNLAFETVPQLAAAVAGGGVGGAVGFMAPIFALEGGNAFAEARERFLDAGDTIDEAERKAAMVGGVVGFGNTILESALGVGVNQVFGRLPIARRVFNAELLKRAQPFLATRTGRAVATGFEESLEEGAQGAWNATVQYIATRHPEIWQEYVQGLPTEMGVGALVGGGFGALNIRGPDDPDRLALARREYEVQGELANVLSGIDPSSQYARDVALEQPELGPAEYAAPTLEPEPEIDVEPGLGGMEILEDMESGAYMEGDGGLPEQLETPSGPAVQEGRAEEERRTNPRLRRVVDALRVAPPGTRVGVWEKLPEPDLWIERTDDYRGGRTARSLDVALEVQDPDALTARPASEVTPEEKAEQERRRAERLGEARPPIEDALAGAKPLAVVRRETDELIENEPSPTRMVDDVVAEEMARWPEDFEPEIREVALDHIRYALEDPDLDAAERQQELNDARAFIDRKVEEAGVPPTDLELEAEGQIPLGSTLSGIEPGETPQIAPKKPRTPQVEPEYGYGLPEFVGKPHVGPQEEATAEAEPPAGGPEAPTTPAATAPPPPAGTDLTAAAAEKLRARRAYLLRELEGPEDQFTPQRRIQLEQIEESLGPDLVAEHDLALGRAEGTAVTEPRPRGKSVEEGALVHVEGEGNRLYEVVGFDDDFGGRVKVRSLPTDDPAGGFHEVTTTLENLRPASVTEPRGLPSPRGQEGPPEVVEAEVEGAGQFEPHGTPTEMGRAAGEAVEPRVAPAEYSAMQKKEWYAGYDRAALARAPEADAQPEPLAHVVDELGEDATDVDLDQVRRDYTAMWRQIVALEETTRTGVNPLTGRKLGEKRIKQIKENLADLQIKAAGMLHEVENIFGQPGVDYISRDIDTGTRTEENQPQEVEDELEDRTPGVVEAEQPGDVGGPEGERGAGGAPVGGRGPRGEAVQGPGERAGEEPGPGEPRAEGVSEPGPGAEGSGERGDAGDRPGRGTRTRGSNYRVDPAELEREGFGPKTRARANIEAIKIVKAIAADPRLPTAEEKAALVQFSGWGGLSETVFGHRYDRYAGDAGWKAIREEVRELLTDAEWEAARASTPNAHYTSPAVIQGIYKLLEHIGVPFDSTLRALEPASGIGHFIGLGPEAINWVGTELDPVTAKIAGLLYGAASIRAHGFEKLVVPDGFFDLAISNVPFGKYRVYDPAYKAHKFPIHDYFIARMVDKTRPGGIVAVVTSSFTMDKADSKLRRYVAERADLLGALRLPNTAFKATANTSVVTDVLFFMRRAEGAPRSDLKWLDTVEVEPGTFEVVTGQADAVKGMRINEYFARNPQQVRGLLSAGGTMYGGSKELTVEMRAGWTMEEVMNWPGTIPEGVYELGQMFATLRPGAPPGARPTAADEGELAAVTAKEGAFVIDKGKLKVYRRGQLKASPLSGVKLDRVKQLVGIRDAVRAAMRTQLEGASDAEILRARKELNKLYDAFVKKHGPINKPVNLADFRDDPEFTLVQALEVYNEEKGTAAKAPVFSERVIRHVEEIEQVESAADALPVVLNQLGRVDLPRIAELTRISEATAREDLRGLVYEDPSTGQLVVASAYLSGNVKQKLEEATAAAETDPRFQENVAALEKVQPEDIPPSQISVSLGQPWLESALVETFAEDVLRTELTVRYRPVDAAWSVQRRRGKTRSALLTQTFGTPDLDAVDLLKLSLQQKSATVYWKDENGNRHVDVEKTAQAGEKQEKLRQRFAEWVWERPARAEQLHREYNDRFNNTVLPTFDGSHQTFPGMSAAVKLRALQRDAVWRIVSTGNTLLGHEVGLGKTYTMIAAAMESRRLGFHRKPMIVVPNHMLEQFSREFLQLYPAAKILVADKKNFAPNKRKLFAARVATGNWDAVIITHSAFTLVGVSPERAAQELRAIISEYAELIEDAKAAGDSKQTIKQIEAAMMAEQTRLQELLNQERKDDVVSFEELGVDMLLVDEAHQFKGLRTPTRLENFPTPSTSQMATDLYLKTRYIDELTPGRGVVFATGTPVSNSPAELYVMQKYLDNRGLLAAGFRHFDAWAAMFARAKPVFEVTVEGGGFRAKKRYAYQNIAEAMKAYLSVADVVRAKDVPDIKRPTPAFEEVLVEPTAQVETLIASILARAEELRKRPRRPEKGEDNWLNITTDGRRVGTDPRLLDPTAEDDPNSKVNQAVERIHGIWKETAADRSTQLVFLDFGVPGGAQFDLYNDIKGKLVKLGIPKAEIAFIHDADKDAEKAALFRKVREGQVRILLGSTGKMGVGTNVQDRLVALHHLDVPWKPAWIEQREGRIIRQGNLNENVRVIRYVAVKTFDAYMWQTVHRKAAQFAPIIEGRSDVRDVESLDDETVLSYAEVKALATGDPRIMEKVQLDADVQHLQRLEAGHRDAIFRARQALEQIPKERARLQEKVGHADEAIGVRKDISGDKFSITLAGKTLTDRPDAATVLEKALAAVPLNERRDLGTVAGFTLVGGHSLEVVEWDGGGRGSHAFLLAVEVRRGRETLASFATRVPLGTTGAGMLQRLEYLVREGIDAHRARDLGALDELAADEAQHRAALDAPFEKAEVLAEKKARQEQLEKELDLSKKDGTGDHRPPDDSPPGPLDVLKGEGGFLNLSLRRPAPAPPIPAGLEEVEARLQDAELGVDAQREKAIAAVASAFRKATKHYPLLDVTRNPQHAAAADLLRQVEQSSSWAKMEAYAQIAVITEGLDRTQVQNLGRLLALRDVLRDVENELTEETAIQFGYPSLAALQDHVARLEAEAARDQGLGNAVARRQEFARTLTGRLVALDLLPAEVLEDDRYYHRQVLEYMRARDIQGVGTGAMDVRIQRKGFQRRRTGTGGDFNLRYQEAEFEWVAQAYSLIARKEALDRLDDLTNVKDQLRAQAKAMNRAAIAKLASDGNMAEQDMAKLDGFRQKVGRANAELAELAAARELAVDGFDDVVEDLGESYEEWKVTNAGLDKADRTPFRFDHPRWWAFLGALATSPGDAPGIVQARVIFKAINEREAFIEELLGASYQTWQKLVPEGYVIWQPERGNHFFLGLTIEERVLDRAIDEGSILAKEDFRRALILGGPKTEWVVPSELARTFDQIRPPQIEDPAQNLWVQAQSSWKQWTLLQPLRWMRYNLNNMSGDLDIVLAYNPRIVKLAPKAARDLYRWMVMGDRTHHEELSQAMRLAVIDSGLTIHEIPDINETGAFQVFADPNGNAIQRGIQAWWRGVREFTVLRENILRLAAYRHFQAEMAAGKTRIYGVSARKAVDAVTDPDERAAKLARELIGDYGNISVGGQWLRRHLMPFYSWLEINAPRYKRLLQNAAFEDRAHGRKARVAGAIAVGAITRFPVAAGTLAFRANIMFGLVWMWNNLVAQALFDIEDEEMRVYRRIRREPTIILGKDEDGSIRSLRFEGAFGDALRWFQLADWPSDIDDLLTGRRDLADKAVEATVKAPLERLYLSWEPFSKTVMELGLGRSGFPTPWAHEGKSLKLGGGMPIRSSAEHITRVWSLNALYTAVTRQPTRPGFFRPENLLLMYRTDPGEAAYWIARDRAWEYKRDVLQKGSGGGGDRPDAKANALYYHKKAALWGDPDAAVYWLGKYYDHGGTPAGLKQSLRMSAPLGSLAKKDRAGFFAWLGEEDAAIVGLALDWYQRIYEPPPMTMEEGADDE